MKKGIGSQVGILGALIFSLSVLLSWMRWESAQGWWMGLGGALGMGLMLFILPFWKPEEMEKLDAIPQMDHLQQGLKEQEAKAHQELSQQRITIETFQVKLQEAEEKIEMYRKQGIMLHKEAERLKLEVHRLEGDLSQKKEGLSSLEKRLELTRMQQSGDPALAQRCEELVKEKARLEELLASRDKPSSRKGPKRG